MPVTDSGRRTLFRLTTLLGALSLSDAAITAALAIHLVRAVGAQGLPLLALRFIPPVFSGAVAPVVLRYIGVTRALQLVPIARAAMLEAAGIAVACRAPLAVVLLLLSADVMVGQFFRPALATILPGVSVSIAELARSTARLGNAKSLGAFLGTTIGAFLGARTGLESTALVCAVAIAVAVGRMPPGMVGVHRSEVRVAPFRAGLRAARHRAAAVSILVASLRTWLRGAWSGVVVLMAIGPLGLGTNGIGLLAAGAGLGGVASLALTRRLATGRGLAGWLYGSLGLAAIALIMVVAIPRPTFALGAVTVWGLCLAVADLTALSVIPRVVDHREVAGVSAVSENAKLILEGLATMGAPALAGVVGVGAALVVSSLVVLGLVTLTWPVARRAEREVADRVRMVTAIAAVPLFEGMRVDAIEILAGGAREVSRKAGETLMRRGMSGGDYWVLTSGTAQVHPPGGPVRTLHPGDGFGELALLHGVPRTADVVATEDVSALVVDRETFLLALTGAPTAPKAVAAAPELRSSAEDLVAAAPSIAALGPRRARELAHQAARRHLRGGEVIFRAGEVGDHLYVVLEGQVGVELPAGPTLLGPGAEFGSIAVLHDLPRTATVTAITNVELALLPASAFRSDAPTKARSAHPAAQEESDGPGHRSVRQRPPDP